MFVTIINDCRDQNAFGRQATRAAALFNAPVTTIGVEFDELEASGHLIDTLDASLGEEGVILVNVAPRHGRGKKWPNGTPFGYFYVNKTLIVSSIDGLTLSLVKKFGLTETIQVLDIPDVTSAMVKQNVLTPLERDSIIHTQFRSYVFVPRVAAWIKKDLTVPSTPYSIQEVMDIPQVIWMVDNFGNCKTTLLARDVEFTVGKPLRTNFGDLTCYNRLKDVPNDEAGLIIGSSGYGDNRFLEVVTQGKSAAKRFELTVGSPLF